MTVTINLAKHKQANLKQSLAFIEHPNQLKSPIKLAKFKMVAVVASKLDFAKIATQNPTLAFSSIAVNNKSI